jgi:hypothetical protein
MLKTSTRFSPSIVRAAEELEAACALFQISPNSKHAEYQPTHSDMLRHCFRHAAGFVSPLGEKSMALVGECMQALRDERVRSFAMKRAALAA